MSSLNTSKSIPSVRQTALDRALDLARHNGARVSSEQVVKDAEVFGIYLSHGVVEEKTETPA